MENNYDNDFDRFFARDLQEAGKRAQPDPHEWPGLSTRLDAAAKQRRLPMLLPWLLLSALVASNGWMLLNWRILHNEIRDLRQQSTTISQLAPTPPDRQTVVIYDTVYRTVVVTQRVPTTPVSTDFATPQIGKSMPSTAVSPKYQALIIPGDSKTASPNGNLTAGEDEPSATSIQQAADNRQANGQSVSEDLLVSNATNAQLGIPARANDDAPSGNPALADLVAAKNLDSITLAPGKPAGFDTSRTQLLSVAQPPIKPIRQPLRWRVGLGVGTVGTTKVKGLNLSEPFSASLQGEVLLGRHWAIESSLLFATYEYTIKSHFDARISLMPPPPPGAEYYFRHFEGRMNHLIPSLSVRYRFRPEKPWSWYVGAGYSARLTPSNMAECEYIEHDTNHKNVYDAPVNVPDRACMGLVQLGMEYAPAPRFVLFSNLGCMFDLGTGQHTFPILAAQLGTKWVLKRSSRNNF